MEQTVEEGDGVAKVRKGVRAFLRQAALERECGEEEGIVGRLTDLAERIGCEERIPEGTW